MAVRMSFYSFNFVCKHKHLAAYGKANSCKGSKLRSMLLLWVVNLKVLVAPRKFRRTREVDSGLLQKSDKITLILIWKEQKLLKFIL